MIAALALATVVVDLPDAAIRVRDVARGSGVADHVIARMPPGRREITLSAAALTALLRRAIPGEASRVASAMTFRRKLPVPVAADAAPLPAPKVARGDAMTLIARSGAVTIERQVAAMQSGRAGGRVFVRDAEGRVFAAPVAR